MRRCLDNPYCHIAATGIVALVLFCQYLTTSKQHVSVLIQEPKFRPLKSAQTVDAWSTSDDDYSRLMDIQDFNFEINTNTCETPSLLLTVIVASNHQNVDKRQAIRETWGRVTEATRLAFLVGKSADAKINKQILNESVKYNDIVQGSFIDAYHNMTYKHVMGLKWVAYHCTSARYILKMDDDSVVNIEELQRFLIHEISPWGAEKLIACQVMTNSRVERTYRSKWRVSPQEYPDKYYPTYCAGWAVIYTPDVVRVLYAEAQHAKYFWIDDVFVTGILAEKVGIDRTPLGNLQLSRKNWRMLTSFNYNPAHGVFLFGLPDMTPELMRNLWKLIMDAVQTVSMY